MLGTKKQQQPYYLVSATVYFAKMESVVLKVNQIITSLKSRLDKHWGTEKCVYNYKASLTGSCRAFLGKVEAQTTVR